MRARGVAAKRSSFRAAIRMLQEIPIVVSIYVFVCYFTDFCAADISKYVYPVFGSSLYIMLRLFFVARRLYVSKWTLVLYLTLATMSLVELIDNIFGLPQNAVAFHQTSQTVFIAGIISSLTTFLYGKFQSVPE